MYINVEIAPKLIKDLKDNHINILDFTTGLAKDLKDYEVNTRKIEQVDDKVIVLVHKDDKDRVEEIAQYTAGDLIAKKNVPGLRHR